MVVKLEGKVDGQTIIFERKSEGDVWVSTIPPKISGIYIVELTATDDAGNVAYCAKYIITVDIEALYVRLEPFDKNAITGKENFIAKVIPDNYKTTIKVGDSQ